jgi:ankyrin repeat protein
MLAALVNACDKGGASLLSLAVRYGYDKTVELLCDSGANLEACSTSVRVVVSKNTAIDVGDRSSPIETDGDRCTRLQAMGE